MDLRVIFLGCCHSQNIMLKQILRAWRCALPNVRDVMLECFFEQLGVVQPSLSKKYRIESVGSGIMLATTCSLEPWFRTHCIFLGHGGLKIDSAKQIPETFDGPLVVLKKNFRGSFRHELKEHICLVTCLVWSHDSQYLASASHDTTLKIWKRDGTLLRNTTYCLPPTCLAWCPTQPILAYVIHSKIYLWNICTNEMSTLSAFASLIKWSPDGQSLAGVTTSNVFICHLVKTPPTLIAQMPLLHRLTPDMQIHALEWSPNSVYVATSTRNGYVFVWRRDGKRIYRSNTSGSLHTRMCVDTWAPNSNFIVGKFGQCSLAFWKVENDTVRQTCVQYAHHNPIQQVLWNADGTLLATSSQDTVTIWKWNNETGRLFHKPVRHLSCGKSVNKIAWHPFQDKLAVAGSTGYFYIWCSKSNMLQTLSESSCVLYGADCVIAWSPDGSLLGSNLNGCRIRIWE